MAIATSLENDGDGGSIPLPPTDIFLVMTNEEILELYKLQSCNVRKLNQVKDSLIKDINFYLRKSDDFQVEVKTKLLAILYVAWSEAQFIQIVYTPSAFSPSQINEIKKIKNKYGLAEGWKKMVNLALQKVGKWSQNSELPNRRKKLSKIIEDYIESPSVLRNKVAHGQWFHALNTENTAENIDLTKKLAELDSVELAKQFEVHKSLGLIIRDLVQSPKKSFHQNYWVHMTRLETYLEKARDWNIESKKSKLFLKPINIKDIRKGDSDGE